MVSLFSGVPANITFSISRERNLQTVFWMPMELADFSCFLCVAFDNGFLPMLSDHILVVLQKFPLKEAAVDISCTYGATSVLIVTISGLVLRVTFGSAIIRD
jgi:hypothetical protein